MYDGANVSFGACIRCTILSVKIYVGTSTHTPGICGKFVLKINGFKRVDFGDERVRVRDVLIFENQFIRLSRNITVTIRNCYKNYALLLKNNTK